MVVREIPRFIQYKRGVSGVQLAAFVLARALLKSCHQKGLILHCPLHESPSQVSLSLLSQQPLASPALRKTRLTDII